MLTMRLLVLVGVLLIPTAAIATPTGGPRIRPNDVRSANLLLQGLQRSATLRRLVDDLADGDLIVYIEMQPRLRARLAGTLTWITATPKFRYVRVSWNPEIGTEAAIATLGHELQHALEVAREASIVSASTLEAFYREHGIDMRSHNGWDTLAARDRGDAVRRDLAANVTSRAIESLGTTDPNDWYVVYRRMRERG
jgi:hypothetical protein